MAGFDLSQLKQWLHPWFCCCSLVSVKKTKQILWEECETSHGDSKSLPYVPAPQESLSQGNLSSFPLPCSVCSWLLFLCLIPACLHPYFTLTLPACPLCFCCPGIFFLTCLKLLIIQTFYKPASLLKLSLFILSKPKKWIWVKDLPSFQFCIIL